MKFLVFFFTVFALNVWYLFSFRSLMKDLEQKAGKYWEKIGAPNSFSASHVGSVLSKLYTKELTAVAKDSEIQESVKVVRVLFPTTFVLTGLMLFVLARLLN